MEPATPVYVPAGHAEHVSVPAALYDPVAHGIHAAADCDPVPTVYVPAGQAEHTA